MNPQLSAVPVSDVDRFVFLRDRDGNGWPLQEGWRGR